MSCARVLVATVAAALLCAACPGESDAPTAPEPRPQAESTTEETEAEADAESTEVHEVRPTHFVAGTPRQEELRGLAWQSLERGDLDTAVTALISLSDTEPMSDLRASGMLMLAELYTQEGQTDRAIELLLRLRTQAPPFAELEFILGRTYLETGRPAEGEDALRAAIRLNPEFLRSYVTLGSLLASNGRDEDASEVFLAYERQVWRMADVLESDASVDEKLTVIDQLSLSLPDDRLSRALSRALDDDSVAVQAAAVTALGHVGTEEAVAELQALRESTTLEQLVARTDEAIAMIEARAEAETPPEPELDED